MYKAGFDAAVNFAGTAVEGESPAPIKYSATGRFLTSVYVYCSIAFGGSV